MELRVWVDGTQRIVCGVQLTTTCQEIVFALAHATQQAGRFTMIERWRNNERLLSPNEQPLVTLQRWGDRMNEVEFILRKTSTDIPANQSANHIQPQQRTAPQASMSHQAETTQSTVNTNSRRGSPNNSASSSTHHSINDQSFDSVYQQHQYNLNRRPQTVLGPSTNSIDAFGHKFMQPSQQTMRLPNSFRASMSTSALPNPSNSMTTSPTTATSMMRSHYADDQSLNTNPSSLYKLPQNGYSTQNDSQVQQQMTGTSQIEQGQISIDHSNDLYSTVNKKRTNQPPAVPAKPRVLGQMAPIQNIPVYHPQLQSVNNDQMVYYQANQSPLTMYPNVLRPRHPPGYLDYMEALASRNQLVQPLMPNSNYAQQNQHPRSNIFQRSFDPQPSNNMPRSCSSPLNTSSIINRFRKSSNPQINSNYNQVQDSIETLSTQNVQATRPKMIESGLIINRGSAVNVRLPSSSQNLASHSSTKSDFAADSLQNSSADTSVSQMGHDMLKMIEEQKKVLINQKNELDLLDNDQEYWVTRQNSEQAELIKRIEDEILQLEDLWKENQAQIKKLENQNFEQELRELKSEQVKMELEISKQKGKLTRCEKDIALCKGKIEQLEQVLNNQDSEPEDTSSLSSVEEGELYANIDTANVSKSLVDTLKDDKSATDHHSLHLNGSGRVVNQQSKESKSSDDEDYEEDSGGDASDDLTVPNNKQRYAKDVVYVDKRGLISGIRSLKLDKSRSLSRQLERSNESINSSPTTNSSNSKEKTANNNTIIDKRCPETNGQYPEKTANNMFLMTL